MRRFILKRIIIGISTMYVVLTLVFFVFRMGPADPVAIMLPPDATPKDAEMLTEQFGLNKPLIVQYANFVRSAVRGDLGLSFRFNEPAIEVLFRRFPATLQLAMTAFVISVVCGLFIGIFTAVKRDSLFDRFGRFMAFSGMSIPSFWLGIMLILFFGVTLRWFPIAGRGEGGLDTLRHLIMPAVCYSLGPIAVLTRLSRSAMIDALKSDYVVMARIKGVPEFYVILLHAFKNASISVVTVITGLIAWLIFNAVIIESVFSWPGIGLLAIESFFFRDYPVVQVFVLLGTFIVVVLYIILDIAYAYIDPRIRYR
jgi:ABC-type dipeptide/oligopeptide/nickel transport system permease component